MKLVFATHNRGKLVEVKALLGDIGVEVVSSEEAGVTEEPIEDGATFEVNALKKALETSQKTHEWSVADDSGICIEALGGEPGVYSKRWAGEDADDQKIIEYTLQKMKNVPEGRRQATFESSVALVTPSGEYWLFNGTIQGKLAASPHGRNLPGLCYDVLFIPEGESRTFGEMSAEEKNALSHRGRAFRQLKEFLAKQSLL